MEQAIDCMDCMDVLYPHLQWALMVDHSSGHAAYAPDALKAAKSSIGKYYGGAKGKVRDTVVPAGSRGTLEFKDGMAQEGEIQHSVFKDTDPPPFYEPNAHKTLHVIEYKARNQPTIYAGLTDVEVDALYPQGAPPADNDDDAAAAAVQDGDHVPVPAKKEKKKTRTKGLMDRMHQDMVAGVKYKRRIIIPYVGKAKGLLQLLWERGFDTRGKKMDDDIDAQGNVVSRGLMHTMANLPVYLTEKSSLEKALVERGRILVMTPKYHPELAGIGIEYTWGKAKLEFRGRINDKIPKNLRANTMKALGPDINTLGCMHAFARRCRDFMFGYMMTEEAIKNDTNLANLTGYALCQAMSKVRKCHRNILDIDVRFLQAN